MGRTGRRHNTIRNCLFLATRDEALVQAAGLIDLWSEGYIEPIQPPPEPYHVLAQQLMALILQERGIGRHTWLEWIARVPAFAEMPPDRIHEVVAWMLDQQMLWEEQGILGIGQRGEETYGRRHFLELLSVFLSPPLFAVLHGRQELGFVDELTFLGKQEGKRVLLLGGRSWHVNHIDWQRRVAYVEVSEDQGRTRWKGSGQGLSFRLSQAIKRVLATEDTRLWWSQRTQDRLHAIRDEYAWLDLDGSVVLTNPDSGTQWWTFAGHRANACLAPALAQVLNRTPSHDSLAIRIDEPVPADELDNAFRAVRSLPIEGLVPVIEPAAVDGLKFSECLPTQLALQELQSRTRDPVGVCAVLHQRIRFVSQ
jgi:ATP-dependent Lhr-like helicase